MEDLLVIRQVNRGDKQAFEKLVQRYQRPLFQYLGRMGLVQEEVEDLVQETFIRAYQHLSRFDIQRAQFSTWLFTIARRLAINALARRRVTTADFEEDTVAMATSHTDRYDDSALIKRRIHDALFQLPLKFRSPVALAYLGEMSMADIASVEACSVGTVKSRIHRGKQRLSVLLADIIGDNDYA